MTPLIDSPQWSRVAHLKPRLRPHVRIDRQYQRGQLWYMLEDRSSGHHYRFTPVAHDLIGAMDGSATLQQIWERAAARRATEAPTQAETLRILSMLHALDLIVCDVPPDIAELLGRHAARQRSLIRQRWLNPLVVRIPLFDPDRLLEALAPFWRLLFTRFGVAVWLLIVSVAALLGAQHWVELSANVVDRALTAENVMLLALLYPCIKLLHELGHAAATKRWGGQVHEAGLLLVALMPMPYVDCSASSMFRRATQRVVVGAAGMMVELFLAAIALFIWLAVEPGVVRSCVFNVILIAGVSTLVVNGNPLLRFDAYYILTDLIGIQNLAPRATRYLAYLCQRYLFGVRDLPSPVCARGERAWFLCYGIASFCYRCVVLGALVWLIAGKYFFIGVLIAIWAAATQLFWPLLRSLKFVAVSPLLAARRWRACTATVVLAALATAPLFAVPMPLTTQAVGVVRVADGAEVRARTGATVARVRIHDGDAVQAGQVLVETEDPFLTAEASLYAAQAREVNARLSAAIGQRVESALLKDELASAEAALRRIEDQQALLTVRSPARGRVVMPRLQDLEGRFLHQGDLIGYVLTDAPPTARVVVPQERVGLIRTRVERVSVRPAAAVSEVIPATLRRAVPGATWELPSAALGPLGGGHLATDPADERGLSLLRPVFQLDLELPTGTRIAGVGERVHVLFDHGTEPLGRQWFRHARQLFLGKFQL